MAVKSKEEILSTMKGMLGDDSSDDALGFVEDVSDTLDDLAKQVTDMGNWKEKYEENDKSWREKYRDRFFSKPVEPVNEPDPSQTQEDEQDERPKTFADLFKTE